MKKSNAIGDLIGVRQSRKLPSAIADIVKMTPAQMTERGLSKTQVQTLISALALAREVAEPPVKYATRITSPSAAMAYCAFEFAALAHGVQEEFWLVTLDTSKGSRATSIAISGRRRRDLHSKAHVAGANVQSGCNQSTMS
jgi:DNA repair protein RadC